MTILLCYTYDIRQGSKGDPPLSKGGIGKKKGDNAMKSETVRKRTRKSAGMIIREEAGQVTTEFNDHPYKIICTPWNGKEVRVTPEECQGIMGRFGLWAINHHVAFNIMVGAAVALVVPVVLS